MLRFSRLFFLAVAASAFMLPPAAASGAINTYRWEDVEKIAIENNASILRAAENLYQAEQRYRSATAAFLPEIVLSASTGVDSSGRDTASLGVTAGYEIALFRGGRKSSEVRRNRYRLEAERHRYRSETLRALYNVRIAFGEVIRAAENLESAQETRGRIKRNYEIVMMRYEAGREDRGALLRSEADVAREDFNVNSAERRLSRALSDLYSEMGIEEMGEIEFEDSLQAASVPEIADFSVFAASHPDYQAEIYSFYLSEEAVSQAGSGLLPALSVSAGAGRTSAESIFDETRWQASVNLRFPFLSSGRDLHALRIARSEERIARRRLEDRKKTLQRDIENAYLDYIDARDNLMIVEMYSDAAAERGRIAMEKYLNGLISYHEWDSIERDHINTRNSLVAARSRLYSAAARWEMVSGGKTR